MTLHRTVAVRTALARRHAVAAAGYGLDVDADFLGCSIARQPIHEHKANGMSGSPLGIEPRGSEGFGKLGGGHGLGAAEDAEFGGLLFIPSLAADGVSIGTVIDFAYRRSARD